MGKLTVRGIESARAKDRPYKLMDGDGLQLRVATDGTKSWLVRYVIRGVERQYRLPKLYRDTGGDGYCGLQEARDESAKIRALGRQGIDYQVQREEMAQAEAVRLAESHATEVRALKVSQTETLTVKDMFDAWLKDGVRRKDGNAELRRSFAADVLPKIGAIAIKDLTEHDLRAVLRAMVDRGVNRAAVMVRNSLTQMFAWAEKRQPWRKLLVDGDPMDLIEIEKIVSPDYDLDNQRDRILSPAEIRDLRDIFDRMRAEFDAAPDRRATVRPVDQVTQCGAWIMLSTLCRVGEMSMARWEHVDLNAAEWFIPKANVKDNVADLTVYLSAFALDQFRRLHEITGHTNWCFPGRGAEKHMDVKSISKQVGDRQAMFKKAKDGSARKPMANRRHDNTLVLGGGKNGDWTPHDLRRTGATMMQSLKVPLELIDRCQNHVLAGSKVRRHYLHHDYADETREAWRILGARLSEILA
jgi:integrase